MVDMDGRELVNCASRYYFCETVVSLFGGRNSLCAHLYNTVLLVYHFKNGCYLLHVNQHFWLAASTEAMQQALFLMIQIIWLSLPGSFSGHIFDHLGFSVYISNTTDILQGTLCFKDSNFTPDTMPSIFNTTCPVHGQYVIYYNERESGVIYPHGYQKYVDADICEVEVYGTCTLSTCGLFFKLDSFGR